MKKMKIVSCAVVFLVFAVGVFAARIDNYFEYAKKNEALLTAFLHKMPKGADLKNNLSYSGYGEYMIDYAINNNLVFDRQAQKFVSNAIPAPSNTKRQTAAQKNSTETKDQVWTASDLAFNPIAYAEVLRAVSLRDNSQIVNEKYLNSFDKFSKAVDYYETIREILTRAVSQNILYVELTASPYEEDIEGWLNKIEIVRKETAAKAKKDLQLGIILSIDRNSSYSSNLPFDAKQYLTYFNDKVSAVMAAAVKFRDKGIVGVSLLSTEEGWIARTQFNAQINVLNRYWTAYQKRGANVNISLPAGSITTQYAPYESLIDHISKSIRFGHAKRISGGAGIVWENDAYALLGYMRNNDIAVEIVPSADENLLKTKGSFVLYKDAGVPITINTDSEGFFRSNLTLEYVKAASNFNLTYQDVKRLAFNALEYSFISGESLFENGNYAKPKKVAPSNSKKAVLQQKLLNDFIEFEKSMEDVIKNNFPNAR
ncbi:MAG: hypothetical protein LBV16_08500 [Elusimicrobiota bacterium]|jgi:adenosine deaminase|nr:hypothetical protein [Elusimicrobiota bacterium]